MDAAKTFSQESGVRIYIIFNPSSGGQKAERLKQQIDSLCAGYQCKATLYPGEARLLAATAVNEGYDTIVAVGGDGTVNEVINGIGDAPDGFSKARLAVLPVGTINVLARELKIPLSLERSWKTILSDHETQIDLAHAHFISHGKNASRYFVQLAGAGLDSNAVAMVDWELKKKIGPLAYVVAGMKALRLTQSKITAKSATRSNTGELVLIGNGRLYGGNFVLFPRADLRDGQLEICLFPKVNWQVACRAGIGLVTKSLHRLCGAQEFQTDEITLTADRKTFLQLDGENVGELPAKISIRPKLLRVLVP